MNAVDRGPLRPFQIVWRSGHVETIRAHQVVTPPAFDVLFGEEPRDKRLLVHAEIDGHWTLLLAADWADVLSVRLLTDAEVDR